MKVEMGLVDGGFVGRPYGGQGRTTPPVGDSPDVDLALGKGFTGQLFPLRLGQRLGFRHRHLQNLGRVFTHFLVSHPCGAVFNADNRTYATVLSMLSPVGR